MKKITVLLLLTICILVGCNTKTNAQVSKLFTNTDSTVTGTSATITAIEKDTLYGAGTYYTMYSKSVSSDRSSNYISTFNVTKISGSGTGVVYLQGSMDGKEWFNVNSGMLGTDGRNSDSLSIPAASASPGINYRYSSRNGSGVLRPTASAAVYYVNSQRWFYFRHKIVLTGTQVTIYQDGKLYTYD